MVQDGGGCANAALTGWRLASFLGGLAALGIAMLSAVEVLYDTLFTLHLEVQVRDPQICATCRTKDCLKGYCGQPGCELGILFVVGLGVIPALLLGLTAWLTQCLTGTRERLTALVVRYAYALAPLSFGVWTAHFLFHFLTSALTIVPVVQSLLIDLGWLALEVPRWDLGPIVPKSWLFPLEVGVMGLGWFGSMLTAYRIAEREQPRHRWQALLPWAGLLMLLLLAGVWLMAQPMEMRGTFFE